MSRTFLNMLVVSLVAKVPSLAMLTEFAQGYLGLEGSGNVQKSPKPRSILNLATLPHTEGILVVVNIPAARFRCLSESYVTSFRVQVWQN